MCGTDFVTHVSTSDAFYDNTCYDLCGVMTYYEGTCGCPHNCYNEYGQGICGSDSVCRCQPDWGGEDCSQPVNTNICSLHGKLISPTDEISIFPFDYCLCDEGYTGIDCSSPELDIGNLPWGYVFGEGDGEERKPYYDDEFGDDHPVWNVSVLATVRVELKEADYLYLLSPDNLYTEDYVPAVIHFDNGHVQQSLADVGFRVKGQGGRVDQKKGWSVKFNKFLSEQRLLDIKKLNFKGCSEDDSFVKIQFASDLYRAAGVPTQRSSYALLYINGVFAGLYFMHEDIASDFVSSRFPGEGDGNLMQLYYNVHLGYYGADDNYYRDKVYVNDLDYPMHYYKQAEGNDDWTDFISWLSFFNSSFTSEAQFSSGVGHVVDLPTLFRLMSVEAFLLASDNLASGNNIYVYHQTAPPSRSEQMCIFTYDYESVFTFNWDTLEPEEEPDILQFFLTLDQKQEADYDNTNPLLNRLLALPQFRDSYVDTVETVLAAVFGSKSAQPPQDRFAALFQFVLPWATRDKLWQLSYGISVERFVHAAQVSIAQLPLRYQNVTAQIERHRSSHH